MNKIKVIFMVLLVFLASNNNSVYAKPHILISTQTSLCYERVYLTVYGDKHGNGDIWRYDNYSHNKFDPKLVDKMNGKIIFGDNLYYYFIIQLATKLYDLNCKCEMQLASDSEYKLVPKYEEALFNILVSATLKMHYSY